MSVEGDARLPAGAAMVRDFVNSYEPQLDAESWTTPDRLRAWFESRNVPAGTIGPEQLALAVRLREGLRALLLTHAGHDAEPGALDDLDAALAGIPVRLSARGPLRYVAAGDDDPFASLVDAIERSRVDGSWERLKVCARDTCRWAFYDASRNRAGRWCSMAGCGNWAKNLKRPERARAV